MKKALILIAVLMFAVVPLAQADTIFDVVKNSNIEGNSDYLSGLTDGIGSAALEVGTVVKNGAVEVVYYGAKALQTVVSAPFYWFEKVFISG